MSTPWLSVLLPVYGVGAALDECVASIVEQGVEGIELVFVDDASPGDEAGRLRAWQERLPAQVRIISHARNGGVSAARNTLLDEARGDYLWFVDPDDLMAPDALRELAQLVAVSRPDLVLCDFGTFVADSDGDADGGPRTTRRAHVRTYEGRSGEVVDSRAELVAGTFRTGQFHLWSKIVRRAAWPQALRFPRGRVFEDMAVFPRLALAARTHLHVLRPWIAYRQRAGSILATLDERKLEDWTLALDGFARDLGEAGLDGDAAVRFEVAHFSARTLLRAMRRHRRLPAHGAAGDAFERYFGRWQTSSPMSAPELRRAYAARRMWGRWLQWAWTAWRLGG